MDKTRNRFYLIMILMSLVMIGVLVSVLLRDRARGIEIQDELTSVAAIVDQQQVTLTAVASYTPPPTATPTLPATPTPNHLQTVQAEATRLLDRKTGLLDRARTEWSIQFSGDFDDDNYEWATDAGEDRFSTATRSISDGAYVWKVDAKIDFFWVEAPIGDEWEDFYISAELSQSDHAVGEQGILFRVVDNQNFYFFSFCGNSQEFHAGRRVDGEWFTLIACTESDLISTSKPNKLAVVGQGNQFLLLINDQLVSEMIDSSHQIGRFGVVIEMDAEDTNTYTFHNFEVRTP